MIKELINTLKKEKNYNESKIIDELSSFVDSIDVDKNNVCKALKETVYGKHYDNVTSAKKINGMYMHRIDNNEYLHGPFISFVYAKNTYDENKVRLYKTKTNVYDFYVLLNIMYANKANILRKWFSNIREEELVSKCVELTINWLCSENTNAYYIIF